MEQLQVSVVGPLSAGTGWVLGPLLAGPPLPLPDEAAPLPVVFSTADLLLADLGAADRSPEDERALTELLTRLLGHSGVPFVVCGVQGGPDERARLLLAGASDALCSHTPPAELRARLLTQSRRFARHLHQHGNLRVNTRDRRAAVMGREVRFTRREFELLTLMVVNRSGLALNEELQASPPARAGEPGAGLIDHMASIRTKLRAAGAAVEPVCLRGVGYRLSPVLEERAG